MNEIKQQKSDLPVITNHQKKDANRRYWAVLDEPEFEMDNIIALKIKLQKLRQQRELKEYKA